MKIYATDEERKTALAENEKEIEELVANLTPEERKCFDFLGEYETRLGEVLDMNGDYWDDCTRFRVEYAKRMVEGRFE